LWTLYDYKAPSENFKLLVGVPDVGLVGPIAASFLVRTLDLEMIAQLDSDEMPPLLLFHKARPLLPVRIYGKDDICILISEVAISPKVMPQLAKTVVDWAVKRKVASIIALSGIPVPNRIEIKTPKVYGAAIMDDDRAFLERNGIEILKEGFMSGLHALIMKKCFLRKISGIALLVEAYLNYPDPGAAASLVSTLSKLYDLKVDVTPLKEQEEEIRIKLRELMKRTMETIRQTGKEYEYTLPPMYA